MFYALGANTGSQRLVFVSTWFLTMNKVLSFVVFFDVVGLVLRMLLRLLAFCYLGGCVTVG